MTIRTRLMGLALASADLLIELDPDGRVMMALGSGPARTRTADMLVHTSLFDQVGKASAATLRQTMADLAPATRSAPVEVLFNADEGRVRRASARFFLLPDLAPNVSCAVTWAGVGYRLHDPEARRALTSEGFLSRARDVLTGDRSHPNLCVSFVDVEGLAAAGGETGERLNARVEAALQAASLNGESAGRLGPERFAMLRDSSADHDIGDEMHEIGLSEGLDLVIRASDARLDSGGDPLSALRAMRFAVEGCLKEGGLDRPELTFTASLSKTLNEAHAFRAMVRDRRFELHYQPIVDLKTGAVHHFEALARFAGTAGPADTIRMAEELALIDGFDLAVAEKALVRLRQRGAGLLKFAVNVSGGSLSDDRYVQTLLRMTSAQPDERRRLIVEITESAALADVEAAARRLSALRDAGIRVCIDDFGTGSASYDYLRRLSVDTVKIDGSFVRNLESDARGRTMIGHLVELCRSLKVETIAEMIETRATADLLRGLGVDQGQGWLFGKAEAEPRTVLAQQDPSGARRLGAVVGWG